MISIKAETLAPIARRLCSAALALWGVSIASAATAATLSREIIIEVPVAQVWDAVRDVGAADKRLAPGLVVSVQLDPEKRIRTLTFANGRVVKEAIISIDDNMRRFAFTMLEGTKATHHNGSFQVFPAGNKATRLVWTSDILPDEEIAQSETVMNLTLVKIRATLEGSYKGEKPPHADH